MAGKKHSPISVPKIAPKLVIRALSEVYDWGLRDLNIPDAHKQTMGEGIKIGIVDTGLCTHHDVSENNAEAANFSDSKTVEDKAGHSTACAGIIAAAKNGMGIVGVAPKAKLFYAKALNDSGIGEMDWITNAIKWCRNMKVDIISISAGSPVDYRPLQKQIKAAYAENIVMVAAAGNDGEDTGDVDYPARYKEVISVGAYDSNRKIAKFSSRGHVVVAAPGVDIYTTWLGNQYGKVDGTSFSCPIIAGVCALILSKHRSEAVCKTPCRTPSEMFEHLTKYTVRLGDRRAFGFGAVDVLKTLEG